MATGVLTNPTSTSSRDGQRTHNRLTMSVANIWGQARGITRRHRSHGLLLGVGTSRIAVHPQVRRLAFVWLSRHAAAKTCNHYRHGVLLGLFACLSSKLLFVRNVGMSSYLDCQQNGIRHSKATASSTTNATVHNAPYSAMQTTCDIIYLGRSCPRVCTTDETQIATLAV